MKKTVGISLWFVGLMICTAVQAQLVMDMKASGTVNDAVNVFTPGISGGMFHLRHAYHGYKSSGSAWTEVHTWRGIIEFNLTTIGGIHQLPTENMQSLNWSAWITGLTVEDAVNPGLGLTLRMFDLSDECEDGTIGTPDYSGSTDQITTLFTSTPDSGTLLNNVNVTTALRNDLFGPGQGNASTGFILVPSRNFSNEESRVRINNENPRLVVNVFLPPPTPTCTPVPTPTPDFPYDLECEIDMPQDTYVPYDICWMYLWVTNHTGGILRDTPVFVILDVHGHYFFAPSFTDFDYYRHDFYPGRYAIVVLGPFEWPEGAG
ncbi:MAG TPA: hypothetical protein PLV45_17650, partial [bacterium]|nr:hypothetical protein [bacterium]